MNEDIHLNLKLEFKPENRLIRHPLFTFLVLSESWKVGGSNMGKKKSHRKKQHVPLTDEDMNSALGIIDTNIPEIPRVWTTEDIECQLRQTFEYWLPFFSTLDRVLLTRRNVLTAVLKNMAQICLDDGQFVLAKATMLTYFALLARSERAFDSMLNAIRTPKHNRNEAERRAVYANYLYQRARRELL